ncbi:MAG TPA: hypothetical protein VM143_06705 [Acidimicrobiales bacterium]|nr:hypothetical protein [Acidimicrobiales bacterium]
MRRAVTTDAWLEVDLLGGGRLPLGYAVLVAGIVLLEPAGAMLATAAAVALASVHPERWKMVRTVAMGGSLGCAGSWAYGTVGLSPSEPDLAMLVHVAVVGALFLSADAIVERRHLRSVAPLYLTLWCAATLLAIASRQSAALALVAAVPLLVTKYSYGRFADIRRTYAQTTRALSLLPEVAGLTPLGHGERTAVYAAALANDLGFDLHAVDRIATAARLHHIGHISLHEPEVRKGPLDGDELRRVSGELLRETGFLDDVAALVEQCQDQGPPASELDAAAVRVCSHLDDLLEAGVGDAFAALVGHHPSGVERTAAIALLGLHDRYPELVDDARAASRILTLVAAGDAGHGVEADPSHDCR